jgi:hypothetical protein
MPFFNVFNWLLNKAEAGKHQYLVNGRQAMSSTRIFLIEEEILHSSF